MIYLIRIMPNGPVKIGFTSDTKQLAHRKSQLQTASPHFLQVIRTLEGSLKDESLLHLFFKDQNIRDEWFNYTPKMLSVSLASVRKAMNNVFERLSIPTFAIEDFNQREFTRVIREFMVAYGISTREFPKILKTPYTSFCRIERSEHGLTIKTAQSLLKAMRDHKPQRRIAAKRQS